MYKKETDVDWNWQAQVRATLLFVIKEGKYSLFISRGLGQGKAWLGGKIEAGRLLEAPYARPKRRFVYGQRV